MGKKSTILLVGIILAGTLCWAQGPFQNILRTLKDHSATLRTETQEMEHQITRIRELSLEIDELAGRIEYKDQKEKMERLVAKTERLNKWVAELGAKTEMLKGLSNKLTHESRMLVKKPPKAPKEGGLGGKCEPGKVWIPGQKSPSGKWVPGHCAASE